MYYTIDNMIIPSPVSGVCGLPTRACALLTSANHRLDRGDSTGNETTFIMEEHVDQQGQDQVDVDSDRQSADNGVAQLNVNRDEPIQERRNHVRTCSRATHCVLVLPFLAMIVLAVISVVCFYDKQEELKTSCILFGEVEKNKDKHHFVSGPKAVCLTVTGVEVALCAFAAVYAIVLVIKAFMGSKV